MRFDIREIDLIDLRRPDPGAVDVWVRVVVAAASAITFAIVVVAPRVLWNRDGDTLGVDGSWFRDAPWLVVITAFICAFTPSSRVSRFVRVAVLLPVIHVAVMIAFWAVWTWLSPRMPSARDVVPVVREIPTRAIIGIYVLLIGFGAWLVARRRRGEWLHAAVMFSLVALLLLGLWLPIAARWWSGVADDALTWNATEAALSSPWRMLVTFVGPPLVGAFGFTMIAIRRPAAARLLVWLFASLAFLACTLAILFRLHASDIAAFVYANFIHVLAAAGLTAVVALVALGGSLWLDSARARRVLANERMRRVGVVNDDGDPVVARIDIPSWLRGPRFSVRGFDIETNRGALPVPAGARLVAPMPLVTSLMRPGETIAVIRRCDLVAVAGFEHHATGQPFRDSAAPVAGSNGIIVGRVGEEPYGFTNVALALWRPCIAYLVILVVIALPALATALVK